MNANLKTQKISALIASGLLLSCGPVNERSATNESSFTDNPPNIVFILTDDLGYGDIGIFGADDIATPNIDQMGAEGMVFTDFYAASSVCSPSRVGLLTGRYPQRSGVNGVFFPESPTGMPTSEVTIAEVLREQGYATGFIGKWHLGHMHKYLPLQRGFDEYFGIPYSNDMASLVYYRGNDVVAHEVDQRYLTRDLTLETLHFIEKNKNKPFFVVLSHPMPHVPLYVSEDFEGVSERGLYGDVIIELDWSVGMVTDFLKEHSLFDNTIVVFTSDNGPWLVMREHGGSSGGLREGKFYTFEGGMRVPTLATWPENIQPGSSYNELLTMMDWFPTFAHLAGASVSDINIDGMDILPVLSGDTVWQDREFIYMDNEELQAYRKGGWKVKKPYEGFEGTWYKHRVEAHELKLFYLPDDPREQNNLAHTYPGKTRKMLQKMDSAYKALGPLPPSVFRMSEPDHHHLDLLREKHGEQFYLLE